VCSDPRPPPPLVEDRRAVKRELFKTHLAVLMDNKCVGEAGIYANMAFRECLDSGTGVCSLCLTEGLMSVWPCGHKYCGLCQSTMLANEIAPRLGIDGVDVSGQKHGFASTRKPFGSLPNNIFYSVPHCCACNHMPTLELCAGTCARTTLRVNHTIGAMAMSAKIRVVSCECPRNTPNAFALIF
jgi:hypothetical protein